MKCGCSHSLAAICGVFAGIAVALFLAGDRCLDGGGRLSDDAWVCEAADAVSPLWSLVTPGIAVLAALAAIGVYLAANALSRRWLLPRR
jgi:hypothetical protein